MPRDTSWMVCQYFRPGLVSSEKHKAARLKRRGARRVGPTHVPLLRRVTHRPVHFSGRQGGSRQRSGVFGL